MLALTIWQPWASLIAAGGKPYEWRGWEAPRSIVARRVAIHAGSRPVRPKEIGSLLVDLTYGGEMATSLKPSVAEPLLRLWYAHPLLLPLASIICTAKLGKPIKALDWAAEHGIAAADSDRVDHAKWAWPLTEIEPVEPMVPISGKQGFWEWKE